MPSPPRPRRTRLALVLVLLVVAGVGAYHYAGRGLGPGGAARFAGLTEVLRAKGFGDWEVVEKPDLPGPYRVPEGMGPAVAVRGQPLVASFTHAGGPRRSFTLDPSPDYQQAVVPLETEGKQLTFAVLRAKAPGAAPAPKK